MNINSNLDEVNQNLDHPTDPVLLVSYVWIGDFVRCHSIVRLLRQIAPDRPVDIVSSTLCAPLADYMPGLRQAIVFD
ncbi:MAG TPA: lipopolysaccharide heptosyltransferase II, partial [Pseudolabrys sp.]|nr:lipopolysaccharide heptosyltransferase II [Pseudolabrys sp.]